ncbi:MAG: STAS domain-containing protein [Bacteroidales bacterium]|nr:STAS domain-containing protein [Bacteroidales bacterium]
MNYKYIKPEYLEMVTGGDPALIKELVTMFSEQTAEIFKDMKSRLSDKDYNSLGLLAHKAKSSVAIMGMESLAEMLKQFEHQAREAMGTEKYEEYIRRFGEDTRSAVKELETLVNGEPDKNRMIHMEKRGRIDIISFSVNKLNAITMDEIRDGVNKVFDNPNSKVIIDLKGVEYIDSSGFAFFLALHKAAKNNYGMLKFVHPESRVYELFQTLHLHTVFEIFDDIDACIDSFR